MIDLAEQGVCGERDIRLIERQDLVLGVKPQPHLGCAARRTACWLSGNRKHRPDGAEMLTPAFKSGKMRSTKPRPTEFATAKGKQQAQHVNESPLSDPRWVATNANAPRPQRI